MKGKPSAGIPFASHQGTGLFTAQGRCSHISAKRKRRHFVVFTLTQRKGMCEGETICGFPLRVPSGYRLIHCTGRVFPYLRQKKKTPIGVFFFWWTRRDSNPRPPRCERGALPTEPRAHILLWRSKLLTYNITIARRCQAAKGQGTRIFAHQHKLIPESRRSPAFPMRS